jgi:predicted transcriptional regulator
MNKKHLGNDVSVMIGKMFKDKEFKAKVMENVEKREMAALLKKLREKESLSQAALAEKASVAQSVIARIESSNSNVLPSLSLYSQIVSSMGYHLKLVASKN